MTTMRIVLLMLLLGWWLTPPPAVSCCSEQADCCTPASSCCLAESPAPQDTPSVLSLTAFQAPIDLPRPLARLTPPAPGPAPVGDERNFPGDLGQVSPSNAGRAPPRVAAV